MTVGLLLVVTARGGSRRLPGKNIRALLGRSLLARTADAIADSGVGAPCLLTTDDEGIAGAGRALGWMVPFLRPEELANPEATSVDAVLHALDWFARDAGGDPDAVMLLQPTSPLRGGDCIAGAADLLNREPAVQAVVGVRAWRRRVADFYTCDGQGRMVSVGADDGRQPVYTPNGALYLVRTPALRAERSFVPADTVPLVMDPLRGLDIDTALDWYMAEAVLRHAEAHGRPPLEPETAGTIGS